MNEPEKVTYRCINTDTKEINSVTFQNIQKLFIENDITWRNKKKEFIYTVRTPTGRDQNEQITKKKNLIKALILTRSLEKIHFGYYKCEKFIEA